MSSTKRLTRGQAIVALTLLAGLVGCSQLRAPDLDAPCRVCVHFDALPTGTQWAPPAIQPGDLVHTENGIRVFLTHFAHVTGPKFGRAWVDGPIPGGHQNSVATDNVNLVFRFQDLAFCPSRVEVVFNDLGGDENLTVNAHPAIVGELVSGSNWTVLDAPIPGGRQAVLHIDAPIDGIEIGGQELWLDSVCAVP